MFKKLWSLIVGTVDKVDDVAEAVAEPASDVLRGLGYTKEAALLEAASDVVSAVDDTLEKVDD